MRRIPFNDPKVAPSGSQTDKNTRVRSHASAALSAATFNLITTKSSVDSGRTARKGGTAKSGDQKSGFDNPLPTGKARSRGMARIAARILGPLFGSSRRY